MTGCAPPGQGCLLELTKTSTGHTAWISSDGTWTTDLPVRSQRCQYVLEVLTLCHLWREQHLAPAPWGRTKSNEVAKRSPMAIKRDFRALVQLVEGPGAKKGLQELCQLVQSNHCNILEKATVKYLMSGDVRGYDGI
nr:uncharacterized protein LOC106048247 isoform X2 [Anser cygnoides]